MLLNIKHTQFLLCPYEKVGTTQDISIECGCAHPLPSSRQRSLTPPTILTLPSCIVGPTVHYTSANQFFLQCEPVTCHGDRSRDHILPLHAHASRSRVGDVRSPLLLVDPWNSSHNSLNWFIQVWQYDTSNVYLHARRNVGWRTIRSNRTWWAWVWRCLGRGNSQILSRVLPSIYIDVRGGHTTRAH